MEEKNTCGHSHGHGGCCHEEEEMALWRPIVSALMLVAGGLAPHLLGGWPGGEWGQAAWHVLAFLPVGLPVMHEAWEAIEHRRDFFSEFMLMTIACIGAFAIGEYPEAVAVMLLYCIGEWFQDKAVERARGNISSLMALRPSRARVIYKGIGETKTSLKSPETVIVGDIIEVHPGERVPLDGELLTTDAAFDTAALTGESVPRTIETGREVLAGMIATETVVQLRVTRLASESAVSRILNMVEEASERKAPTELFIHRFAHVYTPVVISLAALTVVCPWLYGLVDSSFAFVLSEWLHRALVFLVISCPCALVISVPLSYFAGIGAASKRGILFKGGNYLDAVTELQTVVFDKTGTLTTGQFSVKEVCGLDEEALKNVAFIEQTSSHPIAKAICLYVDNQFQDNQLQTNNFTLHTPHSTLKTSHFTLHTSHSTLHTSHFTLHTPHSTLHTPHFTLHTPHSIPGYGLAADGWLVGTLRLLDREGVAYPAELAKIPETIVVVARNKEYLGYILLADTPKEDARDAIAALRQQGIRHIEILSGDKQALVDKVASELAVDAGYGDLLPQDKVAHVASLKEQDQKTSFVGDGINDAPVLALSDVGIAMGALGADMAIETADIIIQTDQPSKIGEAIAIARRTRAIVHQNIALAIGIKLLVMVLGIFGVANLWEAVFADSGVALLAVLNATRIFLGNAR